MKDETHNTATQNGPNTVPQPPRLTFNIPKDWTYTRSVSPDDTTFIFHPAGERPGYTLRISHVRLRKEKLPEGHAPNETVALNASIATLTDFLGADAFLRHERAKADMEAITRTRMDALVRMREALELANPWRRRPGRLLHVSKMEEERYKQLVDEFEEEPKRLECDLRAAACAIAVAFIKDITDEKVNWLALPYTTVVHRNQCPYSLERTRWPHKEPPCVLHHSSQRGFTSDRGRCLLAESSNPGDFWAVRFFEPSDVSHTFESEPTSAPKRDLHESLSKTIAIAVEAHLSPKLEAIRAEICGMKTSIPDRRVRARENSSGTDGAELELSEALLTAIYEKLAIYDSRSTAQPSARDYFSAFMREKLGAREMKRRGWKERTMRNRRVLVEAVICELYGKDISLRKFRHAIDPRVFHAAERQIEAARKRGRNAFLEPRDDSEV